MIHPRNFLAVSLALGTIAFPAWLTSAQPTMTNAWLQIAPTNPGVLLTINDPSTNGSGIHDLFASSDLEVPDSWYWLTRCAVGQTTFQVTNGSPDQEFFLVGITNAIRDGFTNQSLPAEDDNPSYQTDLPVTINFFGSQYSNAWVNENGNITFDSAWGNYITGPLSNVGMNIIAPYWADVDSRNSASSVVTYGTNVVDGRIAFGVDWVNVGYFSAYADRLLSCQLVIIDRSDIAAGDFDMEFNYFKIQWEWGDASVGFPPRAGFYGGGTDYELPGSGVEGAFMDTNAVTGLVYHSFNSTVPGRYLFYFRDGNPLTPLP